MNNQQKCSQCLSMFSNSKKPRKIPFCSHSICEPCLQSIINSQQDSILCEFCGNKINKQQIYMYPLNLLVFNSMNTPGVTIIKQQNQDNDQLLIDSSSHELQQKTISYNKTQVCGLHKNVFDVVCITDKQMICSHCALFGTHKDHRIKSLPDFQRQIKESHLKYRQIINEKSLVMLSQIWKVNQQVNFKLSQKKNQIRNKIEQQFKRYIQLLIQIKAQTYQNVQIFFNQINKNVKNIINIQQLQKEKDSLQKWQKSCNKTLRQIQFNKRIQDKLKIFYQSPLQIASVGKLHLEQIKKIGGECMKKINDLITGIKINFDDYGIQSLSKNIKIINNANFDSNQSTIYPNSYGEQMSEINPFLDYSNLSQIKNSIKIAENQHKISPDKKLFNFSPDRKQKIAAKAFKSIQKQPQRITLTKVNDKKYTIPQMQTLTMTSFNSSPSLSFKRPTSQVGHSKITSKLYKKQISNKQIFPQEEIPMNTYQANRRYEQFCRASRIDILDISQCFLTNDLIYDYLNRGRRVHKLKTLKICNNRLNVNGFERLLDIIQGISNLNLSNNIITQDIFDVIIKNKDKLESVKIINLQHNPIKIDIRAETKIQQIQKFGIRINI